MPKQHRNKALLIKPSSSVPSTFNAKTTTNADHGEGQSRSVNDLIREARRPKKNETTGVNTFTPASIPPSLRSILNMPAPESPPPRGQIRGPHRLRRIPGPPPPRSWLEDSQHAPDHLKSRFSQLKWSRARIHQQVNALPGGRFPSDSSLQHFLLKSLATDWSWHAEYDHTYLSELPEWMRETLLTYISTYDDVNRIDPLPLLFPLERGSEELEKVGRLDLTYYLGGRLTMKKLEKMLIAKPTTLPLSANTTKLTNTTKQVVVPESWNIDEEDDGPSTTSIKVFTTPTLRFANLKHLSLAVDPCSAQAPPTWLSLLQIAPYLSRIISLSLANWPLPTYTPNASQGRYKIRDSTGSSAVEVVYGGTNMYSGLDDDWQEAVGILKSLSRSLYSLTWLDLSGCSAWLPALTWSSRAESGEQEGQAIVGLDWNGSWRNIRDLSLAVGWLPNSSESSTVSMLGSSSYSTTNSSIDSTKAVEHLYGYSQNIQQSLDKLSALRLNLTSEVDDESTIQNVERSREREKVYYKRDISEYLRVQSLARTQAQKIRQMRKGGGGVWIDVNIGHLLSQEQLELVS